jgi:predicted NAD-dependent protein-ADP-ribosyltransferase YbiA (DUF1768 family)
MSIQLRKNLAIITGKDDPGFIEWLERYHGQVFRLKAIRGEAFFQALGSEDEACRVPINITSKSPGDLRLISNFAAVPFELDGLAYASTEAFWQGLKFPEEAKRRELATLHGAKAKDSGFYAPKSDTIIYAGQTVRVGTWDHWRLMELATFAKFEQNAMAREVLLSTGDRPLAHRMKNDSRTIPGAILAEIWMRCRASLRRSCRGAVV